jgi:hypothetical protein
MEKQFKKSSDGSAGPHVEKQDATHTSILKPRFSTVTDTNLTKHRSLDLQPSENPGKKLNANTEPLPSSETRMIDHLYMILDQKESAIKRLQKELFLMHSEKKDLSEKVETLEQELSHHKKNTNELLTSEIESISHQELKKRYIQLSTKLSQSLSQIALHQESLSQLDMVQSQVRISNKNEKLGYKLQRIEKAHTAQQLLVLELQEQVTKSQHLKAIIKKQELVIDKLEKNDTVRTSGARDTLTSLPNTSINSDQKRIPIDEESNPKYGTFDSQILLFRAETAEQRVRILEKQVMIFKVAG